ncbi:hypothetical protein ACGFYM_29885 [Streptomyces sp. NPDC048231]|uniref:hypothetical protein n=1 Tax=Streptomyces sp. NPDC048231 TaxID=3365519 RepID=UPI00372299A6
MSTFRIKGGPRVRAPRSAADEALLRGVTGTRPSVTTQDRAGAREDVPYRPEPAGGRRSGQADGLTG